MIDKGIETQTPNTEDFEFLKQYFNDLDNSDSDKILKTHCLVYLICKYPSNTKAKDDFIKNGADLNTAEELLQSLKAEEDLNLYLKCTFTWDSLYLLKTVLLLGADFGCALGRETRAGKTERVKLLLAADKQTEAVNAKDNYGTTALMRAALNGYTEAVQALLAHNKIEVNAKDEDGTTALMLAAYHRQREAVKALLKHDKIDVNATDNDGKTALMWAADSGRSRAVKALLTHSKIEVNATDNDGKTALMRAARHGYTEAVQALLAQNEIDVNAKDDNGWTALMEAARHGYTEAVKELLAHDKIDVNAKNKNGFTALMYAARFGHTEVVNLLKTHIANKDQEPQIKTQNTKNSVTKKSLFSGAFTASLFAAIAATVSYGLKLPLFTILGGPLVFIALAAVAGFIVGAGLAVAITAYSNKNAVVKSTDNRTHRKSTIESVDDKNENGYTAEAAGEGRTEIVKALLAHENIVVNSRETDLIIPCSNNAVVNGFSAGKNIGTGAANAQIQSAEPNSGLGLNKNQPGLLH